jgi:hypothetical protein
MSFLVRSWPLFALLGLLGYTATTFSDASHVRESVGFLFGFLLLTLGLITLKLLLLPSGWRLLRLQFSGDSDTRSLFIIKSSLIPIFLGEFVILNISNSWAVLLGVVLAVGGGGALFTALWGHEEAAGGGIMYRYCPFCEKEISADIVPTTETLFICPNRNCGKTLQPAKLLVKVVAPPKGCVG